MASTAPDWPGLMTRNTAARYCDMKVSEFEGEVTLGRLPQPLAIGRGERWHRRQLDEALDRLSGGKTPDWRSKSNLYA